jgi:hypothetical protein
MNYGSNSKKESIFENSKDDDIQAFINKKKPDALSLDSVMTKEEKSARHKEAHEESGKTEGISWVVIGLCVVVIILIMIIIYYVMNYTMSPGKPPTLIPEDIVKPSIGEHMGNMMGFRQKSQPHPQHIRQLSDPSQQGNNQKELQEMQEVLGKLETIQEVEEPVETKTPTPQRTQQPVQIQPQQQQPQQPQQQQPQQQQISQVKVQPETVVTAVTKTVQFTNSDTSVLDNDIENNLKEMLGGNDSEDEDNIDSLMESKFMEQSEE